MKLFTFLLLYSHSIFSSAQEKTTPIVDVVNGKRDVNGLFTSFGVVNGLT